MHYYYSIYRKDYIYKGIVLYESMKKHDWDFKFFLICMEEESVELLKKMDFTNMIVLSIKEIEAYDPRIPELKFQRGEKSYIWTAKASSVLYIFDKYPEVDRVIWLDGDTEFLSSPEPIYEQWGDYSVLLTEEKFTGEYEYKGHMVGFYNTGFMGFKKDETGIKCLKYFREKLQAWKETLEEQSSWNDQLYVDDWLERFPNVGIVNHDGINLTPFIASRINHEQGGVVNLRGDIPYIKDTHIVLFHFMALKYYDGNEFDLCNYWMRFDRETIKNLYIPYFKKCKEAYAKIREINPDFYPHLTMKDKYIGNYFNLEVNTSKPAYNVCTFSNKNKILQTLALYYSLEKFKIHFNLWICCSDENSYNTLRELNLCNMKLLEASNLIENYDDLKKKGYEAKAEILNPRLINQLLINNYNIESVLYVDSDCYFHQSPATIFNLLRNNSILLFENIMKEKESDISNAAYGFKRDSNSLNCLFYWVQKTKECLENGMDSYDEINLLNKWMQHTYKVHVLKSPAYLLDDGKLGIVKLKKLKDGIYVNNEALILFKHNLDCIYNSNSKSIDEQIYSLTPAYKKFIYQPYFNSIKKGLQLLNKIITKNKIGQVKEEQ